MKEYLWWKVPPEATGVQRGVLTIAVESLPGKRRIFTPGRLCNPLQVRNYHSLMIAYIVRAVIGAGWDLVPEQMVGISILTEGSGVPFFEALNRVWPNKQLGGLLNVWARRKPNNGVFLEGNISDYEALMTGKDTVLKEKPIKNAIGLIFDIGATGSTQQTVVPDIAESFDKLIFASPCTSSQAAGRFVKTALDCGMKPEQLAVVANEGFFGLWENGTFLSFQLPVALTSKGNMKLSTLIYPEKPFCHIGAGGLAACWPQAYLEELHEDESVYGPTRKYDSLEEAMVAAGVSWPGDFGLPIHPTF